MSGGWGVCPRKLASLKPEHGFLCMAPEGAIMQHILHLRAQELTSARTSVDTMHMGDYYLHRVIPFTDWAYDAHSVPFEKSKSRTMSVRS